jgi:hypothetical protein
MPFPAKCRSVNASTSKYGSSSLILAALFAKAKESPAKFVCFALGFRPQFNDNVCA